MKYVIELNFKSAVHFGSDAAGYGVEQVQGFAHSDTIFSALINTLASMRHEFTHYQWVQDFFKHTDTDSDKHPITVPFIVSSFGFVDIAQSAHTYYIPKPLIFPKSLVSDAQRNEFGKEFKRLTFISLDTYEKWQKNEPLDLEQICDNGTPSFWTEHVKTQHLTDNITLATQIYRTGLSFYNDSGNHTIRPFFIVDLDEEMFPFHEFIKVIKVLSYNGLGGRRTSGCGIFDFSDEDWFCIDVESKQEQRKLNPSFLSQKNDNRARFSSIFKFSSNTYYLFSTFYPDSIQSFTPKTYNLVQRKGWIFSTSTYRHIKRKTCYMFSEGSLFTSQLTGKLVDVTPKEFIDHRDYHRFFRNGMALTIPFCEVT